MGASLRGQGQTRRLALFGTRGVVSRCRDFTAQALDDWGWTPAVGERGAVVEDVLLLVSEMATNACLHAGGPTELVLHHGPDGLRIEVADPSAQPPHPRPREVSLPGGHGLIVLERLSQSWGWAATDGGKIVWVQVTSPDREAGTRAR